MNSITIDEYLTELCKELGPHYRYLKIFGPYRGFIYCEHYYGAGFTTFDKWSRRHAGYPGATARIDDDCLVILDQRRPAGPHYSDAERIYWAQPNFHERFLTIKTVHDAVCKSRHLNPRRARRIKP